MLEMTHEHSGVTTLITVAESANLEALEDAFTIMAHAMGYANSYVVRIGPDEDIGPGTEGEFLTTTQEAYGVHDTPKAWVDYQDGDDDASNTTTVRAAIEEERMHGLLNVLIKAWPDIKPFVLNNWASGYYASKEVAEELNFLAGLLDSMEKEH